MYVPATFVHVTIISAVTDPILTKILGPNFFGFLIFVDQHLFWKKTSFDPNIFRPNNFVPNIFTFLTQKNLLDQKISCTKNFLDQTFFTLIIFGQPKIFLTKNYLGSKYLLLKIFWPRLFRPWFFWEKCFELNFFEQKQQQWQQPQSQL